MTYLYTDDSNKLEPSIAYVCLALFNKIRIPLFMFGPSISNFVQVMFFTWNTQLNTIYKCYYFYSYNLYKVKVAYERISNFFSLDEAESSQDKNPGISSNNYELFYKWKIFIFIQFNLMIEADTENSIVFRNACFSWNKKENEAFFNK